MTTNSAGLKPCPFCGSDMSSFVPDPEGCAGGGAGDYYVECDCGAMGTGGKTVAEAIAAWNRRTAAQGDKSNYAELEREHLGDPDKRTGIYHPDIIAASQAGSAEQVSEREAFEHEVHDYCIGSGSLDKDANGNYLDSVVREHWDTWTGACSWQRAALSAPERKVTDAEIEQIARRLEKENLHYTLIDFARAVISQQGEQTAPEGWISVKDRLPENCVGVIVTDGESVNTGDCEDGAWMIDSPWEVKPDKVTHWMPLPEPPPTAAPSTAQKDGGRE